MFSLSTNCVRLATPLGRIVSVFARSTLHEHAILFCPCHALACQLSQGHVKFYASWLSPHVGTLDTIKISMFF